MLERLSPPDVTPAPPGERTGVPVAPATRPAVAAYWSLISCVLVSVTVRPLSSWLGLPGVVVNLDAVMVPACAAFVALLSLHDRRPRRPEPLTVGVVALGVVVTVSWALGGTRSWAGFGLGFALLLLLPLVLFLCWHASHVTRSGADLTVLRLIVVGQIVFGLVQYEVHHVAARAPYAADLVDGSTSHNLWPAFALPASLVIALVEQHRARLLWPLAVTLLAVYAEAKAALIVWLPAIVLVLAVDGVRRWRGTHPGRARVRRPTREQASALAAVVAFAAVTMLGLWDSPSVKGTWNVLVGHTRDLEHFATTSTATNGLGQAPTLKAGWSLVSHTVTSTPDGWLFGLGPGNSVSHAAEVLAEGPSNGASLPTPGPVAVQLLTQRGNLQFEDAQSTWLGLWGDLGTVGVLAYLGFGVLVVFGLVRRCARSPLGRTAGLTVILLVGGVLGGGTLLDWPEQASVVLPVGLAVVALLRAAAPGREDSRRDAFVDLDSAR